MLWLLLWHLSYLLNNNLTFCCDDLIVVWLENILLFFFQFCKIFLKLLFGLVGFHKYSMCTWNDYVVMGFKSSWLNIELFYIFCDFLVWILSIADTDAWKILLCVFEVILLVAFTCKFVQLPLNWTFYEWTIWFIGNALKNNLSDISINIFIFINIGIAYLFHLLFSNFLYHVLVVSL